MTIKTSGLGRGLGALIPRKSVDELTREVGTQVLELPIASIVPNTRQPREYFSATGLDDLMQSIAAHGILQPLIVRKTNQGYELIAGERRLRASKLLGLATVPAIVRSTTEEEQLELALLENLQREDLNPIEEAKAYHALADEFHLTHEDIAKKVGKSRPVISNMLRLLELAVEMQQAVAQGKVSYAAARALLGVPVGPERNALFRRLMGGERISSAVIEGRTAKAHQATDPNIAALERQLREALGTKVSVKRQNGRGSVSILFYSDEELRNLIKRLCDK